MIVVTGQAGRGDDTVGIIQIGDHQGTGGGQGGLFDHITADVTADYGCIVGAGNGDDDGLDIGGSAVRDLDGVGQEQALGLVEVVEGFAIGAKGPVEGAVGRGIGQATGDLHHGQQGRIEDARGGAAFGDRQHGRTDDVGGIDIGQGQGTGTCQRTIGLG